MKKNPFNSILCSTLILSAGLVLIQCKGISSSGSKNTAGTNTGADNSTSNTDCTKAVSESNGGEGSGGMSGESDSPWKLADTAIPTYSNGISAIFAANCTSCHSSSGTSPDLSSYTTVKAASNSVQQSLTAGSMPPSGSALADADKAQVLAWLSAGAKEGSASGTDCATTAAPSNSGTVSSDWTTSGSIDNDTASETTNPSPSPTSSSDETIAVEENEAEKWDDILLPEALLTCRQSSKIYDRLAKDCDKAKIAISFECTRAGIVSKFAALSVSVTTTMNQMDSDGYVIDQCGEYNSEPLIYFYKKIDNSGSLSLSIRRVCKKGSSACPGN